MLVSVSWDRTARVHLLEPPYTTLAVCEGHEDGILAVTALREGRAAFATGGADGTVRVWACPPTFAPLALLKAHAPCAVRALAALPNEGFVSGGSDGTLHLWHVRSDSEGHDAAAASRLRGAGLARDNCAKNDKGKDNDQSISFVCQTILKGPPDATVAVATAHHAMILLAGSLGHRLQVWRIRHHASRKHTASGRERRLSSSDSVNEKGVPYKRARLLKPDECESVGGDCLAALEAHQECVFSVAVTPCGTRALSGGFDSAMVLWDLEVCAQLGLPAIVGQACSLSGLHFYHFTLL
jgi:WD40 repeat protein